MLASAAGRDRYVLKWFGAIVGLLLVVSASVACTQPRQPRRLQPAEAGTLPAGANGDIKVHDSSTPESSQSDDPQVCVFYLAAFNFDPNSTQSWTIHEQPGTAVVLQGTVALDENGHGRTADITLPDGQYKVEWPVAAGGGSKSKVFKVDCAATPIPTPAPTPTPSESPSPSVAPTPSPTEAPPTPTESETPTPTPSGSGPPSPTPPVPTRSPSGGGGQGSGGGGSQVGGNPSGGVRTGGGGTSGIEDFAAIVLGTLALLAGIGAATVAYRRRRTHGSA